MSEFVYDKMTPELEAFLFLKKTRKQAAEEGIQFEEILEKKELSEKVTREEIEAYNFAKLHWNTRDEAPHKPVHTSISPCGKYKAVITAFPQGNGYWNLTKAKVYEGDRLIIEMPHYYHQFTKGWATGHPKGDFLLCTDDYQSIGIVDLKTGEWKKTRDGDQDYGFCPTHFTISPDHQQIVVSGCYWAAPYEDWLLDFSDPMSLPWRVIHKGRISGKEIAWEGDDCFLVVEDEIVDLPGHRYHGLTEDQVFERETSGRELDGLLEDINDKRDVYTEIEEEAKRRGQENEGWATRERKFRLKDC